MTQNINIVIAFFGGILAFFSPCFLPLVPVYLAYITGLSFEELKEVRAKTVVHSLLFILGFTVVFTSLGMAASYAGHFFAILGDAIQSLGGLVLIILGLHLMRVIRLPFLDIEKKLTVSSKPSGYIGTLVVGMAFAVGWSPCVGPILAGILVIAGQSGKAAEGFFFLLAFSLGIGLPLFLASLAVNFFLSFFKKIEKYLGVFHFGLGLLLVIFGVMLVTNYFSLRFIGF
jgi:cytochrome c-type biogenesis protein